MTTTIRMTGRDAIAYAQALDRVREVADASDGHETAAADDTSFEFGANAGDRFADASKAAPAETETRFG